MALGDCLKWAHLGAHHRDARRAGSVRTRLVRGGCCGGAGWGELVGYVWGRRHGGDLGRGLPRGHALGPAGLLGAAARAALPQQLPTGGNW